MSYNQETKDQRIARLERENAQLKRDRAEAYQKGRKDEQSWVSTNRRIFKGIGFVSSAIGSGYCLKKGLEESMEAQKYEKDVSIGKMLFEGQHSNSINQACEKHPEMMESKNQYLEKKEKYISHKNRATMWYTGSAVVGVGGIKTTNTLGNNLFPSHK